MKVNWNQAVTFAAGIALFAIATAVLGELARRRTTATS